MWTKYPKMKNMTPSLVNNISSKCEWIIIEKIHGSNFSIMVNDNTITYARRNDILNDDENFYSYKETMNRYQNDIKRVWDIMKSLYDDLESLTIYGEYFGGYYNDNTIKQKPVQREVLYSNEYDFIPFDIKVNRKDRSYYIDWNLFNCIILMTDFNMLKPIMKGKLEEVIKYNPNDKLTTVPLIYGLEDIKGNNMEGVIVRPEVEMYTFKKERLMFKNKSDKFSEKISIPKIHEDIPEEIENYLNEFMSCLNRNRLNSVVSKELELTDEDFGRILSLFMKDVKEDINIKIDKNWERKVYKKATPLAVKIVKDYFSEL